MAEVFDPYYKWLGIPPAEQPPNHYRLLGLTLFEADLDVLSNAADQRMAHVRTFQTGRHSDLSQKILTEIAGARVCLLNAEKKADYDRGLQAAAREPWPDAQAGPPAFPQAPPMIAPGTFAPPPIPAVGGPFPPSIEAMTPEGSASGLNGLSPVAWVDDSESHYHARPTKAAWHGAAIFLGVLMACGLGLWLAWQKSVSQDRVQPAPGSQAAVPAIPSSPDPDAPPEKAAVDPVVPSPPPTKQPETPTEKSPEAAKPDVGVSPPTPAPQPAQPMPPRLVSQVPVTDQPPIRPTVARPEKHPAPDAAAQKAAETKLAILLSNGSLAVLRAAAQDTSREPAERFVLFAKAVDRAVVAGEVAVAMELIDEKARQFQIEAVAEKVGILTAMRDTAASPETFNALTEQVLTLMDEPSSLLPREQVRGLAEMAIGVARKSGDSDLIKRATLRFLELRDSPE